MKRPCLLPRCSRIESIRLDGPTDTCVSMSFLSTGRLYDRASYLVRRLFGRFGWSAPSAGSAGFSRFGQVGRGLADSALSRNEDGRRAPSLIERVYLDGRLFGRSVGLARSAGSAGFSRIDQVGGGPAFVLCRCPGRPHRTLSSTRGLPSGSGARPPSGSG